MSGMFKTKWNKRSYAKKPRTTYSKYRSKSYKPGLKRRMFKRY